VFKVAKIAPIAMSQLDAVARHHYQKQHTTNKVKFAQRFTKSHGLVPADTEMRNGNSQGCLSDQLLHKRKTGSTLSSKYI